MKTKWWLFLISVVIAGGLLLLSLDLSEQGACSTFASPRHARGGILNDGRKCAASLVFKDEMGPEKDIWLVIRDTASGGRTVFETSIRGGCGGWMEVEDFNGDGLTEVFVYVNGQKTEAVLLQFKGSKKAVLYRLAGGRPTVLPRCRAGSCVKDIVEYWYPGYLKTYGPKERIPKYILRIFRWTGKKYVMKEERPSNFGTLPE